MIHLVARRRILGMRVEARWLWGWWNCHRLLLVSRLLLMGTSTFVVCARQIDGGLRNGFQSSILCSQLIHLLFGFCKLRSQIKGFLLGVQLFSPGLIQFTLKILVSGSQRQRHSALLHGIRLYWWSSCLVNYDLGLSIRTIWHIETRPVLVGARFASRDLPITLPLL
jgi:hypothetical protein